MTKESFNQLLTEIVAGRPSLSDLILIPGRPIQTSSQGRLEPYLGAGCETISPAAAEAIAKIVMENSELLANNLRDCGSCDCSYELPGGTRFRVNVYFQRGQIALVMRRLSNHVPRIDQLGLPPVIGEIAKEHSGIVFITGATGSGKTTTLAAILHEINRLKEVHIVTLEDPIEYVHTSVRASFSQREFGKDFFNFATGLKAALRQAPRIILVGEIRDRETMEVALSAAETGHLVFSTLHTINAAQSINRILGMFHRDEEQLTRQRLADTLRWVVGQQLVRKIEGGAHLVTEVMGNNLRSREAIQLGESERRNLHEIIESSAGPLGWHSFEQSLLQAFTAGLIAEDTAIVHASLKAQMRQTLDRAKQNHVTPAARPRAEQPMFVSA